MCAAACFNGLNDCCPRLACAEWLSLTAAHAGNSWLARKWTPQAQYQVADDAGSLACCQWLVISRLLRTSDVGLIQRVLSFLKVQPPRLCTLDSSAIFPAGSQEQPTPLRIACDASGREVLLVSYKIMDESGDTRVQAVDLRSGSGRGRRGSRGSGGGEEGDDDAAALDERTGDVFLEFNQTLEQSPEVLWLDLDEDRAAAGMPQGCIYVWSVTSGSLLLACHAYYWETPHALMTWGHSSQISAIAGAFACTAPANVVIASGDSSGNVCLWNTDGTCCMCASAMWELRALDAGASAISSILVTANGLVLCSMLGFIVAFKASVPQGEVAFVLSTMTAEMATALPSLAMAVAAGADSCCSGTLVAAREDGAMLSWDLQNLSSMPSDTHRRTMHRAKVLAPSPLRSASGAGWQAEKGQALHAQAHAVSSQNALAWIGTYSSGAAQDEESSSSSSSSVPNQTPQLQGGTQWLDLGACGSGGKEGRPLVLRARLPSRLCHRMHEQHPHAFFAAPTKQFSRTRCA
mmetsp:Transcript_7403/g.16262  ORF Transcript_7403/g.16262 Transcript_7403/m.16262 type:complete len:520 (-) Transcript_7403:134-1693(-)